jgi:hypothetical protein
MVVVIVIGDKDMLRVKIGNTHDQKYEDCKIQPTLGCNENLERIPNANVENQIFLSPG